MIWITADDIILIQEQIIRRTGGLSGVRDLDGLEAAIAAPMQSFLQKIFIKQKLKKSLESVLAL